MISALVLELSLTLLPDQLAPPASMHLLSEPVFICVPVCHLVLEQALDRQALVSTTIVRSSPCGCRFSQGAATAG